MAKICILCRDKIGMMQGTSMFGGEICLSCAAKLNNLNPYANKQDQDDAYNYFQELLSKVSIPPEAEKSLKDRMLRYENNVARKLKKDHDEHQNKENAYDNEIYLVDHHLITGGYSFEGYRIVKYCGMVSGESVLGSGFFSELNAALSDAFGVESEDFAKKMSDAKHFAQRRLMHSAAQAGGNAVICVDFDYINIGSNMIGVSANGTAVKVETIQ